MDNYDLSNLLLLADSAVTRERHPKLMDEQNRRANFSKRSTTVSTTEQAEQQLPSTGDEQIPEQRVLAGFDISLASSIPAPLMVDEPVVDEPEDPFAALAAYQPRTFDDDTQQPLESSLGLLGDSNTSEAVLAEPDGNDVHEPPEQSQGESCAKGIGIPESAISDTVSGKQRASEPESSIKKSVDPHFQESSRRFDQLTIIRRKPDGTETEFLPLPRTMAVRSHYTATLVKSTASQKSTKQSPQQSLRDRVKKETEQWIVRLERGVERRYVCGYPNCGLTFPRIGNLKNHIFKHTGISIYQCTYPQCADKSYFRNNTELQRHMRIYHTKKRPHLCTTCKRRHGRLTGGQSQDQSLRERVKKETEQWIVRLERDPERRYVCGYPNCNSTYVTMGHLKRHIFKHIGISVYKCTYPECSDKPYFRSNTELHRHVQSHHESAMFYFCKLCNRRYGRLDNYKRHMRNIHKIAV